MKKFSKKVFVAMVFGVSVLLVSCGMNQMQPRSLANNGDVFESAQVARVVNNLSREQTRVAKGYWRALGEEVVLVF